MGIDLRGDSADFVLMILTRIGRVAAASLVAGALASSRSSAQADSTWREYEGAMQSARAASDTVTYRVQLAAIHHAIGSTPRIAARYAALALAALDKRAAAQWLGAVAAMGSALDTAMLARYAELAGPAARASLLAAHARATSDVGAPELVYRLPDSNMIAEDIAFDARRSTMLVSSVRSGSIYAKHIPGSAPVVVKIQPDSGWGIFALGIDCGRGVLWATTAAFPMGAHWVAADSGRSALLKFDLQSGALRGSYVAPDSGAHALGDLAIDADGAVYVSDGVGTGVYVLDAGSSALRTLVPPGLLVSPQTPALSSDGETLFVPDYAIGVASVNIRTGVVSWIAHSDSLALTGIDGMYRSGRDLIAVQNGLEPNRIVRLSLDAAERRVSRATTLVRGSKATELTHATVSGGWLYFIRKSGWGRVAEDGAMTEAAAGEGPHVVRVRLTP